MITPNFLQTLILLDIAYQTSRVPGKSLTQIGNEMQTQLGNQPANSFIRETGPGEINDLIVEMEIEGWLRLEQGLYTVTDEGKNVLRQVRPLLQSLNVLFNMVGL